MSHKKNSTIFNTSHSKEVRGCGGSVQLCGGGSIFRLLFLFPVATTAISSPTLLVGKLSLLASDDVGPIEVDFFEL
jgi:hypothetical protein